MSRTVLQKYLLLICITFAIVTFYHVQKQLYKPRLEKMIIYESVEDLGRRDPSVSCIFPMPHPFDPSILDYIEPAKPIRCFARQKPLTYIDDDGTLRFNKCALTEAGYAVESMHCDFAEIMRTPEDDFNFELGTRVPLFEPVRPSSDFVSVSCYNVAGITHYHNFHAHAQRSSKVRKFMNDKELGVAVIGLDSMSRLNFMRQLPETYKFIKEELGGITMLGFNKVGENTFPNVIPMLTGSPPKKGNYNYFQDWPFIWYNFEDLGAATMYSEDLPTINMFDYIAEGILNQPTLHYMRTFWLAVEKSMLYKLSSVYCMGGTPKHVIYFNYLKTFLRTYKDSPSFIFSLFNEPTHDYINTAGIIDNDLTNFLNSSYQEGLFNRTVLIILGDHGNRMDSIRSSKIGQIEDKMPMVSIILPKWTDTIYPEWRKALEKNKFRLLSSYDLYYTFSDILDTLKEGGQGRIEPKSFPSTVDSFFLKHRGPGMSLFKSVPVTRDCEEAGIPENFCVCYSDDEELSVNDDRVLTAAKAVIDHFNVNLLKGLSTCSNHTLKKVQSANLRRLKGGAQRVELMLWTNPGEGLFEATVHILDNYPTVTDALRINRYGSQANCLPKPLLVKSTILRSVCYCIL